MNDSSFHHNCKSRRKLVNFFECQETEKQRLFKLSHEHVRKTLKYHMNIEVSQKSFHKMSLQFLGNLGNRNLSAEKKLKKNLRKSFLDPGLT